MEDRDDLLSLGRVARRLGITRHTLRRRIADWGIATYPDPSRTGYKLVSWGEIRRAYDARLVPTNGKGEQTP